MFRHVLLICSHCNSLPWQPRETERGSKQNNLKKSYISDRNGERIWRRGEEREWKTKSKAPRRTCWGTDQLLDQFKPKANHCSPSESVKWEPAMSSFCSPSGERALPMGTEMPLCHLEKPWAGGSRMPTISSNLWQIKSRRSNQCKSDIICTYDMNLA